jgi:hypothetical protein
MHWGTRRTDDQVEAHTQVHRPAYYNYIVCLPASSKELYGTILLWFLTKFSYPTFLPSHNLALCPLPPDLLAALSAPVPLTGPSPALPTFRFEAIPAHFPPSDDDSSAAAAAALNAPAVASLQVSLSIDKVTTHYQ